jgi:hypothetical protein
MDALLITMDSEGTEDVDEWLDMTGLMTVVGPFNPGLYPGVIVNAPGLGELPPEDMLPVGKSAEGIAESGVIARLKVIG